MAIEFARMFGQDSNGIPNGRQVYDLIQSELGAIPSNVSIVAGQIANLNLSTTSGASQTVTLMGVTGGNTLIIAYGIRSPNSGETLSLLDSQSQSIVAMKTATELSNSTCGYCGVYAGIFMLAGALAGTHGITFSTTDSEMAGSITIYEINGLKSYVGATAVSTTDETTAVSPLLNVGSNRSWRLCACCRSGSISHFFRSWDPGESYRRPGRQCCILRTNRTRNE
jgi:hypothetical protein